MYNFLDPKLSPKVNSSAPSLDDYEVTNLISNDFRIHKRGFMAFPSIKPPIDIHFEFICDIAIRYITLHTTVGAHKTTGIEILAGEPLISLGKHIYEEEPGMIMCDSKFYSKQHPPASTTSSFHLGFFKSFHHRVFTSTNKLCVRIVRTDCRSVPCLGTIEVWGYVASKCSKETKQTIHRIINAPIRSDTDAQNTNLTNEKIRAILECNTNCDFIIPDDFKDALTYEVMAIPMTLPSGNTIDQTTLEKCMNNDITYGRRAADPFTGLEFLPSRRPVLNAALKSRIDMFLLKHSNQAETKTIGRTLGEGTSGQQNLKGVCKPIRSRELNVKLPDKRRKIEVETTPGKNLDDAIASAMNSADFICFTNNDTQVNTSSGKKSCYNCKSEENLYEVTVCGHYFCRTCLIAMQNVCGRCKIRYVNCNVVKVP